MLADKIVRAVPILAVKPRTKRRTREVLLTLLTLCVLGLELYLSGRLGGLSSPVAIVSMAVAAATLLLAAWQTDLTRRPATVFGAIAGLASCNAPFLAVVSIMSLDVSDPISIGTSAAGIVFALIGIVCGFCCLSAFTTMRGQGTGKRTENRKAVIVLGKVLVGGRAQWQLERRCWKAVEMLETDPSILIICCGGISKDARGRSRNVKECEVMRRTIKKSLKQRGHTEEELDKLMSHVLMERTSTKTNEKFDNLAIIFDKIGLDYAHTRFGVLTADYHVKRAMRAAHDAGFKRAIPIGIKTQWDTAFVDWNQEIYVLLKESAKGRDLMDPLPGKHEKKGEKSAQAEQPGQNE